MLLGRYYITNHAIKQYGDRMEIYDRNEIIKSIKKDLRTLNIRRIVYGKEDTHVFTKGHKEFIFAKSNNADNTLALKTVVKRNKEDTIKTIYKRQNRKDNLIAI